MMIPAVLGSMGAETFRSREVHRYYQPQTSTESLSRRGVTPPLFDTGLTAFAQLIALRLEAQRAIISLIDNENEYFLAESTSNIGLLDAESHAQNHFLFANGARLPRTSSLSAQALALLPSEVKGSFPAVLVPDLRLHERLGKLGCVAGAPYLKFYCGVPLTNHRDINIGSVYVVDDRARPEGIGLEQAQFLAMMATTVMAHLENNRAKDEVGRVTRMSQGLHAFMEGHGTMRGDWQRLKTYNLPTGAGIGFRWQSAKSHGEEAQIAKRELADGPGLVPPPFPLVDSDVSSSHGPSTSQGSGTLTSSHSSASSLPMASPSVSFLSGNRKSEVALGGETAGDTQSYFNQKILVEKDMLTDNFSDALRQTFSRASNLIREGMGVDGALYFNAPVGYSQRQSKPKANFQHLRALATENASSSQDEEGEEVKLRAIPYVLYPPYPQLTGQTEQRVFGNLAAESGGRRADILGFSTSELSSLRGDVMEFGNFSAVDQKLLTSLIRHYPQGKHFIFDDGGVTSPFTIIEKIAPKKVSIKAKLKHDRKTAELIRLFSAFPKAQHIFFVPLFDPISRCFIGSFAWSTSETRSFSTENDLSYLVAFGHSVMTEVSRLDALSADRAKEDFIGNISHELRSPLHGILASAEFLHGTSMDGLQRNLVDTVSVCGRTLLDTIEHVLDFSKIKAFGQNSMEALGAMAEVDISEVIEEVLGGVYAGFEYNNTSPQGLGEEARTPTRGGFQKGEEVIPTKELEISKVYDGLTVILDIDFREHWRFATIPGAWRRLTMNLFGNALKYTSTGWIKVKLEARALSPTNHNGQQRMMVFLIVSDSGKGISSDFMKNRLYVPFSQEDVTSPGTGLGMSIVKQIVDLSGGDINIKSDEEGTEVRIGLPLWCCPSRPKVPPGVPEPISTGNDVIVEVIRRARGKTASFHGFDDGSSNNGPQSQGLLSLKESLSNYLCNWFKFDIVDNDPKNCFTDVVIWDESTFLKSGSILETKLTGQGQSNLVLCSGKVLRKMHASDGNAEQVFEFVSGPCGPIRLAKALLTCFNEDLRVLGSRGQAPEDTFGLPIAENVNSAEQRNLDNTIISEPLSSTDGSGTYTQPPDVGASLSDATSAASVGPEKLRKAHRFHKRPTLTSHLSYNSASNFSSSASARQSTPPSSSTTSGSDQRDKIKSSATELSEVAQPTFGRGKMLLVEDNPVNMMLLSTYMKKKNWAFETGENGLLALQAFENRPQGFEVIFMDISMPIMTGYEAMRLIRAVESARALTGGTNPRALIVALTGLSSQRDREMAFEAGADVFMTKPVKFSDLSRVLEDSGRLVRT